MLYIRRVVRSKKKPIKAITLHVDPLAKQRACCTHFEDVTQG